MSNQNDRMLFCVLCFADNEDGSWGSGVMGDEGSSHCLNCGAGGSAIPMQRWAVENIRRSASWVGKRYYANEEDIAQHEELKALRKLVKDFPGRVAEPARGEGNEGSWMVCQALKKPGSTTSILVKAASAEAALEDARDKLPYVPEPHTVPQTN